MIDMAWAYNLADEVIADVQRGGPAMRELVTARLLLIRVEGQSDGLNEARATVERILPPVVKLS